MSVIMRLLKFKHQKINEICTNFDRTMSCDDTVHGRFREGIKCAIWTTHKVRLQQIATLVVVFELSLVQLHPDVGRLEV